jgi:5-methylthioadenosine/S-adenosylhomocysteine deaminase
VVDLLIKNAFVMTMDSNRRVYRNGAVAINEGRIADVGESNLVAKEHSCTNEIDAAGMAVLPGFINLHNHLSEKFIPGLSDDLDLYSWLSRQVYPVLLNSTPDECHWMAMLGCIEMIKSGVTCFVDTFGQLTEKRVLNKVSEAVLACGMRAYVSREIEEITDKSAELAIEDTIATLRELRSRRAHRVQVRLAPGIATTTSTELLEKVKDLASGEKLGLNMHMAETVSEVRESKKRFGDTPVRYVHRVGLLGPDMIAAHCVWVDSEEIGLLAKSGTNVAYSPISNMKLADGVAPIWRMLEEGVNVGLGTDGAASNDNLDMFSCLKTGSYLQKLHTMNPALLPSTKVIEMATISGAKALRAEHELGSIETGKRADMILLDLRRPNIAPVHDLAKQIVCSGGTQNVDTVIVDGGLVMEHRQILLADETEVVAKAREASGRLISRAKVLERLRGEQPGIFDLQSALS